MQKGFLSKISENSFSVPRKVALSKKVVISRLLQWVYAQTNCGKWHSCMQYYVPPTRTPPTLYCKRLTGPGVCNISGHASYPASWQSRVWVLTQYERSGAATGDDNLFRCFYVKTLYLTHYKRSGASDDERSKANRSRNLVIVLLLAATELGKFLMKFSLKKLHRKLI